MCEIGKWLHQGALCFVELVEHVWITGSDVAVQYNSYPVRSVIDGQPRLRCQPRANPGKISSAGYLALPRAQMQSQSVLPSGAIRSTVLKSIYRPAQFRWPRRLRPDQEAAPALSTPRTRLRLWAPKLASNSAISSSRRARCAAVLLPWLASSAARLMPDSLTPKSKLGSDT